MKKNLLKLALIIGLITTTSILAKAQKFGDNLGNHTATKDLQMAGKSIFNAAGIAIGSATITNTSIALQVDGTGNQAILIPRVSVLTAIAAPLNGMIAYNNTDDKFYVYQGGAWVTFSLGFNMNGDVINTASTANGYTLALDPVTHLTVLKLSPADITNPGVVTVGTQSFAGDKSFAGNVNVLTGKTLTVTDAATILGGTVTAAGDVTVGTTALPANTALNGNLAVTGTTVLNGTAAGAGTDADGSPNSGIQILNPLVASVSQAQRFIVVDSVGRFKVGTFSGNSLAKYKVPIAAGTSAGFNVESNSGVDVILTISGITADDAIVVNFPSDERAIYAGLSILSATATGTNTVTVTIADFRNPAEPGYAPPAIDAGHLIVTKYTAVNH